MSDEPRLKHTCRVALLADYQRVKIVLALKAGKELSVGEVARVLAVSISLASHHLRRLHDLGILEDRTDGKLAYYSLRDRFLANVALAALAHYR
jgi:DNA-binding transcriptional ArsR family regulator